MTTIVSILVACRKLTAQEQLIHNLLSSEDGRKDLSTFMSPVRKRRDYHALGRSLFVTQPLPHGALPTYTKDDDDGEA